jgi:hypothetical protein
VKRLMITADGGTTTGYGVHLCKIELQRRCHTHAPRQSKRLCVRHFARAWPATHEVIADVRQSLHRSLLRADHRSTLNAARQESRPKLGECSRKRMEREVDHVLSCRNHNGAEDHIGFEDFGRSSVDRRAPPRMPDIIEYQNAA